MFNLIELNQKQSQTKLKWIVKLTIVERSTFLDKIYSTINFILDRRLHFEFIFGF
jgi:hypothetical protein